MAEEQFNPAVSGDDCQWWYESEESNYFGSADLAISLMGAGSSISVRFPSVTIPPGATITSAHVSFIASESIIGDDFATCYLNDADDAVAPTTIGEARALVKTSGVSWTVPYVTEDTAFDTPDLTGILQDVIDRAGWESGNAVQIIVDLDTMGSGRNIWAIDGSSGQYPAELHVTWDDPPSPASADALLPAMTGTGTLAVRSGMLAKILPTLEIDGTILGGAVGTLKANLPRFVVSGYGAGRFAQILPALTLQSSGVIGATGGLSQNLTLLAMEAHGFTGALGRSTVFLPVFRLSSHGFNETLAQLNQILRRSTNV